MKYLLDTNICIYLIKKKPPQVIKRLKKIDISDVAISSITLSELYYGVEKSVQKVRNKLALTEFLAPLEVLPYDDTAAVKYGNVRWDLEREGKVIGPLDMLIAAHALSLNLILVTNNEKEFKRVLGLRVENWA